MAADGSKRIVENILTRNTFRKDGLQKTGAAARSAEKNQGFLAEPTSWFYLFSERPETELLRAEAVSAALVSATNNVMSANANGKSF
jgi:hypothetical protein